MPNSYRRFFSAVMGYISSDSELQFQANLVLLTDSVNVDFIENCWFCQVFVTAVEKGDNTPRSLTFGVSARCTQIQNMHTVCPDVVSHGLPSSFAVVPWQMRIQWHNRPDRESVFGLCFQVTFCIPLETGSLCVSVCACVMHVYTRVYVCVNVVVRHWHPLSSSISLYLIF